MSTFIKEDVLENGSHQVNICNQNSRAIVDQERLKQGILLVLRDYEVKQAVVGHVPIPAPVAVFAKRPREASEMFAVSSSVLVA